MNISAEDIIKSTELHPYKIKNIYLYGSRIYGTHHDDSDYDFIVIANNIIEQQELKKEQLNIHIHIPEKFHRDLFDHDIHALECIFAPDHAKIKETISYKDFKIKPQILSYKLYSQSFNSFKKAKECINRASYYIGLKSLWHSLRILKFGIQIKKYGKIVDFSEANILYDEILNSDFGDWEYYKEKYLPIKIELEKKLKN